MFIIPTNIGSEMIRLELRKNKHKTEKACCSLLTFFLNLSYFQEERNYDCSMVVIKPTLTHGC